MAESECFYSNEPLLATENCGCDYGDFNSTEENTNTTSANLGEIW